MEPSVPDIPRSPQTGAPAVSYANACATDRQARLSHSRQSNLTVCQTTSDPLMAPRATDAKIFAMLKTLITVIRELVSNLRTPAARAASQILDSVIPVMDLLEGSQ